MQPETRRIVYIVIAVVLVVGIVLGVTLGVVLNKDNDDDKEKDKGGNPTDINTDSTSDEEQGTDEEEPDIINSYNNTDELLKKYPLENNVTIRQGLERNILNRLLTGFENWNRGFKAWKAWGNILYTQDSIYNVNGVRMTLAHYQQAMDVALSQVDIILGVFHNIIVNDNYTAIYYDSTQVKGDYKNPGTVMEFVLFTDYGEELGTRVVEGWGGTQGDSFENMRKFQGDEEREYQDRQIENLLNYEIPQTDNLTEKYKIINPTNYIDDNADDILKLIYEQFDAWNKDEDLVNYDTWVRENYLSDAHINFIEKNRTLEEYLQDSKSRAQNETITKLYFDNILIRDNWAAIHYRFRNYNQLSKNTTTGDRMQFFKFEEQEDNTLKISGTWIR